MARLAVIALLLVFCLTMYGMTRPFGGGQRWVRLFLRRAGSLLGLRVTIAGRPVTRRVLYAANHISWLDILALGGAQEVRFVAKAEIAGWALIGTLARVARTVFVSRDRRSATRAQADDIARALGEGQPVGLFAEGGTGDTVTLAPFRPALFAAAGEAAAAVQPVAIDYGERTREIAWPRHTRFSTEMKRMLNRTGAIPVTLHFLPPLDAALLDRKALAGHSHAAVAAALGQPPSLTP